MLGQIPVADGANQSIWANAVHETIPAHLPLPKGLSGRQTKPASLPSLLSPLRRRSNPRFCRKVWYLRQIGKTDHNYFKNLQCQKLTKNKLCDRTLPRHLTSVKPFPSKILHASFPNRAPNLPNANLNLNLSQVDFARLTARDLCSEPVWMPQVRPQLRDPALPSPVRR